MSFFWFSTDGSIILDADGHVSDCDTCICGGGTVVCDANPDADLPATLTLSVTFCGASASHDSVYSPSIGDWIFAEYTPDEFIIAETAEYRLTCSSFRVSCCADEGVFWMYGTFAFYKLGLDGITWTLLATSSPAVNWNDTGTTKCFTGTPQWDPNASLVINNTNPFSATFTFYPHYDINGSGYSTEWTAFTTDLGCADNQQPVTIGIA